MGLRFRRSITIFPGVRLNFGLGGMSLSLGPRGASMSFGGGGVPANVGLSGTGLSYRTRLDRPVASKAYQPAAPAAVPSTPQPSTHEDHLRSVLSTRERDPIDWSDIALTLAMPAPDEHEDPQAYDAFLRRFAVARFARRMVEGDRAAWFEVLREELRDETMPFDYAMEWGVDDDTGRVHIDVQLPAFEVVHAAALPTMKARALYEDICCATLLRLTAEIFRIIPDVTDVYATGFISGRSDATGAPTKFILLRMLTDRDSFSAVDLDHVDPSSAFGALGGASKLSRGLLQTLAELPMELDV